MEMYSYKCQVQITNSITSVFSGIGYEINGTKAKNSNSWLVKRYSRRLLDIIYYLGTATANMYMKYIPNHILSYVVTKVKPHIS